MREVNIIEKEVLEISYKSKKYNNEASKDLQNQLDQNSETMTVDIEGQIGESTSNDGCISDAYFMRFVGESDYRKIELIMGFVFDVENKIEEYSFDDLFKTCYVYLRDEINKINNLIPFNIELPYKIDDK